MRKITLLISILTLSWAPVLWAQQSGAGVLGSNVKLYTLQGNMSVQTHAYSTTRANSFRDPLGMLATMNLNYSLLGFRSGMSFRYSTDNSQLRQSMNQISFRAGYRWVDVAAGDVSPTFNKYSLRGMNIKGAEVQVNTAWLGLHAVGGRVNKRIDALDGRPIRGLAYERWLYAGRMRLGRDAGSHVAMGVVYSRDDDAELLPPDIQSTGPNRVPVPEENLTISPDFRFFMFSRRVEFKGENTVSVFTRDIRSESLDVSEAGVPEFFTRIYTPRTSTRVNFATSLSTRLNFRPVTVNLGYDRVQPGFRSLGLRNVRDDDQNFSIQPQVALMQGRLNLSSSVRFGRDNLLNQRTSTQYRNDVSLNAQKQISERLALGAGYSILINRAVTSSNVDADEALNYPEQVVVSQTFNLQPSYNWTVSNASHSISLSGNYQSLTIDIDNIDRDLNSTFFTTTASYNLSYFSGLNINTGVNYASGNSASNEFNVIGFNTGIGYAFFNRKVNVNLTGGMTQNSSESYFSGASQRQAQRQINGNFTAMYRPIRSNTIRFTARTVSNSFIEGAGMGFNELEVRLTIDQRF